MFILAGSPLPWQVVYAIAAVVLWAVWDLSRVTAQLIIERLAR